MGDLYQQIVIHLWVSSRCEKLPEFFSVFDADTSLVYFYTDYTTF